MTASSSARQHCEEFLNETADASPSMKLLRRSRAIVMECLTALGPAVEAELVTHSETVPVKFSDDLAMERSLIFETYSDEPGWPLAMLQSILTISRMGVAQFEIELKDGGESKQRVMRGNPYALMAMAMEDDWQTTGSKRYRVLIYAVRVK